MGKAIDLTGQRFGKLLVIERIQNDKDGNTRWLCKCDCGEYKEIMGSSLRNNLTSSCGCIRKERAKLMGEECLVDIIGQKFGRLLVIERDYSHIKDKETSPRYLCQCDCGNTTITTGRRLKSGTTTSCGCFAKEIQRNCHLIEDGIASFNKFYNGYKISAKRRGYAFELDKDYFKKLISECCFYCGNEPSRSVKSRNNSGDYVCNGIDRVDNIKGYILNNVVSCCPDCNFAKGSRSHQEFLSWIERVYNHSIKENK